MPIEFDSDYKQMTPQSAPNYSSSANGEASGMTKWLINHSGGMIQSKKAAELTLIGLTIILLSISAYFMFFRSNELDLPDVQRPHNNGQDFVR